ncbi:MAG: hypothetical protein CMJ83_19390 [Planctomycetes bacterium]|nr:hypothetical protein [Planctomycetota bacterium]
MAALAAVTVTHPSEVIAEAGEVFVGIALASAPALLIAYLAVGFVHELLPSGRLSWLRDRGPLAQAAGGVLCGLPLPVCSCGIVPLYRELVLKGAPVAAALAFLVATPELEVAAFLLTYELMGAPMAVARVGAAAAIALFVGWIVGRRARPPADAVTGDEVAPAASRRPGVIGRALRFGLTEAVDHTAAWILLGLGVAALLSPYLSPDWAAGLWPGADVLVAALLGLPLYVCASGSTPVAAILVLNGMSPGAALAFLLTGPATNVTTFGLLSRLHGRGTALRFGISMIVLSVGAGLLVNAFLPALDLADPTRHVHDPSWVSIVSLGLLGLAFFASFLRQGTRRFIERVALAPTLGAHDAPDHDPGADDHDGSPRPCCGPERDAVT